MVDVITLSLAAADILGERLNLDVRQYPFEIPRPAESAEARQRVFQQVTDELAAAGLADDRGVRPEVQDALYLLCSSEVCITVAGLLDVRTGRRLAARVVATGEVGLVGVIDGDRVRMDFMPPDDLPGACVNLLPDATAGAGGAVRAFAGRHGPADADGLRALQAVLARPKRRIGHFVVTRVDRRGRRARLPGLTWFDNDLGRYTLLGERSADGQDVLTCLAADKVRIADQLGALLGHAAG